MLDEEHFKLILDLAANQLFNGKGVERHGGGLPLDQQPWKVISDNVGTGFVLGQAMKKLMELKIYVDDNDPKQFAAFQREALGAIVYTAMAIMYKEYMLSKNKSS